MPKVGRPKQGRKEPKKQTEKTTVVAPQILIVLFLIYLFDNII
jgi:hypothetical protein